MGDGPLLYAMEYEVVGLIFYFCQLGGPGAV